MRIIKKEEILKPFESPTGELIYEMIGSPKEIGGTTNHSFVYVVIPPKLSSPAHYHKTAEETYYITKGEGRIIVDNNEYTLTSGQACLIMPNENHQIFNDQEKNLEFLCVSAPAFDPEDMYF